MKKLSNYRQIISLSAIIALFEVAFGFFWFRPEGTPLSQPLLYTLISGLVFYPLIQIIVGRFNNLFYVDYKALQTDKDAYRATLAELGKIPLKGLELYSLILVIYLLVVFSLKTVFPIRDDMTVAVFCVILSLGLLNGALVFVMGDRLVTEKLLENKLDAYPPALRSDRQVRKIFIIPMFMTIMALLFASSITYLTLRHANGISTTTDAKTFIIFIAATLFYICVVFFLVRIWNESTTRVYKSIIDQLDALTSTDRNLTNRIFITSIDELGTIAGLTNKFCSALENDVVNLKSIQKELSATGSDLEINAEISGDAVENISISIGELREKTVAQSASVGESSVAVRQITKNIESLDTMIANQASSIDEASSSIEEMVGTIGSINTSIEQMAKKFNQLSGDAAGGKALQGTTGSKIADIVARSNSLQEANKVVAAIAAQTNLLAMNAAIEAAHAGDAGRGFSVVADEIRRLADTSSKESRKIKNEIHEVQLAIQDVVVATKDSERSFTSIAERIGETDSLVRELHMAISEQHEGASRILDALKSMNEITTEVRTGSREMNSGSGIISLEIQRLQESAQKVTENMNEMSANVDQVTEGAEKVYLNATTTKKAIQGMDSVISSFTTR